MYKNELHVLYNVQVFWLSFSVDFLTLILMILFLSPNYLAMYTAGQSGFHLSVIKPKPTQLLTN